MTELPVVNAGGSEMKVGALGVREKSGSLLQEGFLAESRESPWRIVMARVAAGDNSEGCC